MTLLAILHIAVCLFLVVVILLQPGKGDAGGGIGFGSSSSQSIFGSRGAGNFLTKTTSACAVIFLATSFFLTRSRIMEYSGSVIKKDSGSPAAPPAAAPVDVAPTTAAPAPESKAPTPKK